MEIRLRQGAPADLPLLSGLVSAANDAPYDFAPVAGEKLFGPGFRGAPVVMVAEAGGEAVGVSVSTSRALRILAVSRKHRRKGVGRALLRDAEQQVRREGHRRMTIAAEAGNYFTPGVSDADGGTGRFLTREGYRHDENAVDLRVDLTAVPPAPAGKVSRALVQQRTEILDYVEREFAASWAFEIARTFDAAMPTLFVARTGGNIAGFAAIEANNRGLGSFGPEGVSSSARGHGLGKDLLLHALADLRRLGYREAVIPWVSSIEFYQRSCGAEVAERFTIYSKVL